MKKLICVLLASVLLLALAACGGTPAAGTTTGIPNTFVMGGLAPLTGDVAFYGNGVYNGARIAIDEINASNDLLPGVTIEYINYDEKGDPTEAVQAFNTLMQDGMVALMGDVTTGPTLAVAQRAVEEGIPMITPTGTGAAITETGANIFRVCFTDPFQGELLADYAFHELGAKTAAVLYDIGDDYSSGIAEAFEAKAAELGMEITASEGYPNKNTDYNAQLTKIKANEPDVIFASGYYQDAALITTQARDLGINSIFMGPDGWDGVLDQVGENTDVIEGYYYCSQYSAENPSPELQSFMTEYRSRYGEDENMFAVLGYEAVYALAYAIQNANSVEYDAVIAALMDLDFQGLTGAISFRGGRDPARDAFIIQFEGGAEKVLGTYSVQG